MNTSAINHERMLTESVWKFLLSSVLERRETRPSRGQARNSACTRWLRPSRQEWYPKQYAELPEEVQIPVNECAELVVQEKPRGSARGALADGLAGTASSRVSLGTWPG